MMSVSKNRSLFSHLSAGRADLSLMREAAIAATHHVMGTVVLQNVSSVPRAFILEEWRKVQASIPRLTNKNRSELLVGCNMG